MVSLSNNTQGNVNITTRNGAGVNISSNNDTDISANMNGNSQRAKSWAVGEGLIDGVDYSAKHYAQEAKESEEIASHAIENIDTAKEQALSAIDDEKTSALNDIDTEKTEAIAEMETAKDEKIGEIEETAAGFEDDLEALATRAETAATNAETSETNAATSATSASTSATNAAASAETATSAKNAATNAASSAETYRAVTETYRNQAYQYRDDAQNYARQASGSANTASSKAEVAKSYAQDAATASGRAEQAKDAAEGYAEQAEAAKDDIEAELDNYVPNTRKVNNKPLSADITLTSSDVGALANSTKYGYSIDLSLNTTNYKLTLTLKDQDGTALNTKTVDFPIESVVVNGSYDSTNKKIVLTLQSGTTIDIPVGDLISGLQTEITSTNKLDADLVDDTSSSHKFATAAQLNQIATNTSSISNLASVATSGDYTDLTNKPTIPTVPTNISAFTNDSGYITKSVNNLTNYTLSNNLATVATSGSYNDLSNKPTIPAEQVQADWNVTDTTSKAYIKNKPTIPSGVVVDQTFDPTSTNAQSGVAIAGAFKPILNNIVVKNVGNTSIGNYGTNISCTYGDDDYYSELYIDGSSAQLYYEDSGSGDNSSVQAKANGVLLAYTSGIDNGVVINDITNNDNVALTVSNSNLAVNGTEVALSTDIPDISTKQDTLVSGTNIKTINNTSLLGSGNVEVLQNTANYDNSLCIYGTLVSGMASTEYGTAVGYGTQAGVYSNAFGKSARATGSWAEAFGGNCTASGDWSVVVGHNNEASGNYSTALGGNAEATATRAIQLGEGTNSTASSLQIGFGTSYNYTLLDGTTGLIPDARINSALIDGQWVDIDQAIISSATSLNGSTNLTYRVNLPNDGHKYEVMIRGNGYTGSTSGNEIYIAVIGNEDTMSRYACRARNANSGTYASSGTVICTMSYVASNAKNLTLSRSTSWNGSCTELKVIAYRRIGTNT